jgi:capsular polysaccharide biosynthesis protein
MEVRRYLLIVRRRLALVLAIVIAALIAGWLITPRDTTYTATATLYVGGRSIDIAPSSGEVSADRVTGFDRFITTFSVLAQTQPVAAAAVEEAGVPRSPAQVAASTKAEQVTNTNLIKLSVTDSDPAVAQALANAVAGALVDQVLGVETTGDSDDPADQVLSVYEPASLPSAPNSNGQFRNLALAGLFGLIVAGALVALLEHLDIRLRTPDDVERQLELPVLAVVPVFRSPPVTVPVTVRDAVLSAEPGPPRGETVA